PKLPPDFRNTLRNAGQAPNAALLQCRVQTCKVVQLHRHRTRRAPQYFGKLDDLAGPFIQPPKRQSPIEIEREEVLLTRPRSAVSGGWSHGSPLPKSRSSLSRNLCDSIVTPHPSVPIVPHPIFPTT